MDDIEIKEEITQEEKAKSVLCERWEVHGSFSVTCGQLERTIKCSYGPNRLNVITAVDMRKSHFKHSIDMHII